MLIDLFKQYMKVTRGIKDKSVGHYITGINTINNLLVKNNFFIKDVFQVHSFSELEAVKMFLETNTEFLEKDASGHNMYSVAFNHFYRFACNDEAFFSQSITQMDVPISVPKMIEVSTLQWPRNQIVISQAIEGAKYCCEHDLEHKSFIARTTGKPYMEGHHLIPLKNQPHFTSGLDTYANVVCLCPICHKLLHYGTNGDRTYVAEQLFEMRAERLVKCGIDLSKSEFLGFVLA